MATKTINLNIDVNLLRDQRDTLLRLAAGYTGQDREHLEGIVNMIEHIMDQFEWPTSVEENMKLCVQCGRVYDVNKWGTDSHCQECCDEYAENATD